MKMEDARIDASYVEDMNKKVLLIGHNPTVLRDLASALSNEGFGVRTTNLVEEASRDFDAADFDLIAFGRGIDETTNTLLKAAFSALSPTVHFVDGLGPVIPLLVRQIKLALSSDETSEKVISAFSCQQADRLAIHITIRVACQLKIDLYQLNAVHQTHQQTLVSSFILAGNHTFSVDKPSSAESTINFLAAETNTGDLAVLPL